MDYVKAQNVLPEDLLEAIQQYMDGGFMYIPRKSGKRKAWGENSGTKNTLKIRDKKIYEDYINGKNFMELTKIYYLSEQSIRRIVKSQRNR